MGENAKTDTENQDAEESVEATQEQVDEAGGPSVEEELADMKDQLLRTLAELENVRKRAEREKEDAAKYAIASFARDILTVGDNLNRAIESAEKAKQDQKSAEDQVTYLEEGVTMTRAEFLRLLKLHGIEEISPKGEKFSADFHQAMVEVESDQEPGTVVECFQTGFKIKDRLLRPAMVSVSKKG